MFNLPAAFAAYRTGIASVQLMAEAQAVIAMRMWGLAGWWSVTPAETTRMFSEKPAVMAQAASAAMIAAMTGKAAHEVADAWMVPVTRRARANRRRLIRRGPARL